MTDVKLPELPKPAWTGMLIEGQPPYQHYTAEQMNAHGMACYEAGVRAGMERAARIGDSYDGAQWRGTASEIAKVIAATIRESAGNGGAD